MWEFSKFVTGHFFVLRLQIFGGGTLSLIVLSIGVEKPFT